ncbi:hypothetical protein roselon_01985 [Roseibacterium elongatum DSM 19469]|uniref:Uncharacterized protein n=1 Tax=Roseicyclus elongatus DSM 19469 TaxID=1294273 RepID=W8RT64_9RHOB|nr:hypothetical protein roselon_01985 [Roseibacterium elongatum DSM 19469]
MGLGRGCGHRGPCVFNAEHMSHLASAEKSEFQLLAEKGRSRALGMIRAADATTARKRPAARFVRCGAQCKQGLVPPRPNRARVGRRLTRRRRPRPRLDR